MFSYADSLALTLYKIVFTRYPADTTARVYLARAYLWQGNTRAAINAYTEVLKRTPAHAEARQFIIDNRNSK